MYPTLYRVVFRSAQTVLANQIPAEVRVTTRGGTPWYRYVGYRNNMPQAEAAGRTQFLNLANDVNNRWTGLAPGGGGSQGLYLSADFVNANDPFPELSHYQAGPDPTADLIPYYDYHPGAEHPIAPDMRVEQAGKLRSMFLFSVAQDQPGLDLRLQVNNGPNPLLEAIRQQMTQDPEYAAAVAETQGAIDLNNLNAMYQHPNSADFCRALGNAALALPDTHHVLVTSVRDGVSTNVVARTQGNAPVQLNYLDPEGRATYFVDSNGRRGAGVFTIQDMVYNISFEEPGAPPPQLPEVQAFKQVLIDAQQISVDELAERLTLELSVRPANHLMDNVAARLENVQQRLTGNDYGATITAIDELRVAVTTASNDPHTANVFRASLELSKGVSSTMGSMADAVRAAQERIDGMAPEPPGEIEDPNPEELEPARDPVDPVIHGQI
jgi:hypothetical protein